MLAIGLLISATAAAAEVQWDIVQSLPLEAAPRDLAVTHDGRTLYILTEKGEILIYGADGVFKDKITVGPHADRLKIGQDGELLYIISRENKTVEALRLDFIHKINTIGSPFQGPGDAPVVLAVFSDFQ